MESGSGLLWRAWRNDASPTIDLDGKTLPLQASADVGSSTESLKLSRHADERSSGKSNKSTGSGYLTMSCIKHEPSEDSDASEEKPIRPPRPSRTQSSLDRPLCEYVDVAPRELACREYELMTNFMSHARDEPPAVPPRAPHSTRPPLHPKPDTSRSDDSATSTSNLTSANTSNINSPDADLSEDSDKRPADTISNDDSLLDELRKNTYCVLKVCEDDTPDEDTKEPESSSHKDKEDYGIFSRISIQRKSNPIKTHPNAQKPLKTSNSTSNVHDAAQPTRPFAERMTPFFMKKKPKPPEEPKSGKKEDNLMGRLTPRFSQSRLYGRGQSLELAPAEGTRLERSATTAGAPSRHFNSSIVANFKLLSLHRFGAQEDVECRRFVQNPDGGFDAPPRDDVSPAVAAAAAAEPPPDAPLDIKKDVLEYVGSGPLPAALPCLLATTTTNDIRL